MPLTPQDYKNIINKVFEVDEPFTQWDPNHPNFLSDIKNAIDKMTNFMEKNKLTEVTPKCSRKIRDNISEIVDILVFTTCYPLKNAKNTIKENVLPLTYKYHGKSRNKQYYMMSKEAYQMYIFWEKTKGTI